MGRYPIANTVNLKEEFLQKDSKAYNRKDIIFFEEKSFEHNFFSSLDAKDAVSFNKLIFNATNDLYLILDKLGRIIEINSMGIKYSAFKKEDILGNFFWKMPGVFKAHNISRFISVYRDTLKNRPTKPFLEDIYDKEGKQHLMKFSTYPIYKNGNVNNLLVVAQDVTDQHKIREKLNETDSRFGAIFNNTSDLIASITFSKNPTIIYASPSHERLLGYNKDELIGTNIFDLIHDEDKTEVKKRIKKHLNNKTKKHLAETISYRIKTKNNDWLYLETVGNALENEIVLVSRNITERKIDEQCKTQINDKLTFLSNSAIRLVNCKNEEQFYYTLGSELQKILPNSYLIISKYSPKKNTLHLKWLDNNDAHLVKILNHFKVDKNYYTEVKKEAKETLLRGKLAEIPGGIHETSLGKMSKTASSILTKLLSINKAYVVGLTRDKELFGSIVVFTTKHREITDYEFIQLFFNQASIIIQRLATEDRIKKQNIELKRLDKLKNSFLNMTSHELRTPMTAIRGHVEMMINGIFGNINEEQKQSLEVVIKNTKRLDNLINDILDISRIQSGTMKFILGKCDIDQLLQETKQTMESSANQKEIKITLKHQKNLPKVVIDADRIKQVIINLLNNSIKFSDEKSEIFVSVEEKKQWIQFTIKDQGRGIPIDKLKTIFEPFVQVEFAMDRAFGGAGLGLAISKGIIVAHGGKIWAESKESEGSIFRFTIPKVPIDNIEENFKNLHIFDAKELE